VNTGIINVELNVEPSNVAHDNSIQILNLLERSSQTSSATTPVSCLELPQVIQTTSGTSTEHATAAALIMAEAVDETHETADEVNYIPEAVLELKQVSSVAMRMRHLMLLFLILIAFFIVLAAMMVIIFDVDAAASLLDSVFHSLSVDWLDFFESLRSFINDRCTWSYRAFKYQ